MRNNDLDKIFEEGRLDKNVLDSLLVFSAEKNDDRNMTTSVREYLLRSVAGGVLDYLGCSDKVHSYDDIGFLIDYTHYVSRKIAIHEKEMGKLQPRLQDSLKRLFKAGSLTDYTGSSETTLELYDLIPKFIGMSTHSIISLPRAFVESVEGASGSYFSKKELDQLRGIADKMHPYIRERTTRI